VIDRVRIDHVGSRGGVGVGASIETASFGATSTPPQSTLDAHIDRFQFWPRFPRWTVSATAQRLSVGDVSVMTSRAELDVDVRNSLRIVVGAERGTARDALGVLHTVFTLKIERSSSVGVFDHRVVTGVVFEDRNGNGVRDPGEPGVPGIVVHRGSETAVTDANGEYRMNTGSTARADVDDRSLPRGWMQSPRLLDRPADVLELGVVPMAALDVRIDVAPLADGSSPAVRVGTATLVLRDSTGREWIARAGATLRATFDAMPPGRYTLTTELDGSSEPLTVDPTPEILVAGTASRQRVVVTVRTRPVRIFKSKQQIEKRDRGAS
jgi:SdrD B-like domain